MKKILAILLAMILTLTLFACQETGGEENENTPTNTDEPTKTVDDITENGLYMDYPGVNGIMDYRTQGFTGYDQNVSILCTDEVKQDPEDFDALRDIYNIKIVSNIISPPDMMTKFLSMYMGDESCDIARIGLKINLINKGYFKAIDDYVKFDLGIWKDIKQSVDTLYYNNHIYVIATYPGRWNFVWWNSDLFEEMGVKTPQEYYEENNWTWETFRETAIAMNIDADADGTPEVYGCAIDDSYMFIGGTGMDFVTINPDGTVTNNVLSPEIARSVNSITDMRVKDMCVYDGTDAKEQFAVGKIAMVSAGAWYRVAFPELIKSGVAKIVPYPRDVLADKYYLIEDFGSDVIPSNAKNPVGAAAAFCAWRYGKLYFDLNEDRQAELAELSIDEQMTKLGWTLELENWTYKELYSDKFTPTRRVYEVFGIQEWWGDVWFRPQMGEPWATIAEELAPKFDERIASTMES